MSGGVVVEVREPGRLPLRLVVTDRLPIGRAGEGLVLTDSSVSRHHCELRLTAAGVSVRDLGSSNGTLVHGRPITAEVVLAPGDVVVLGEARILVDPDAAAVDDVSLTATVTGVGFAGAAPDATTGSVAVVPPTVGDVDGDVRGSIALVLAEVVAGGPDAPAAPLLGASVVGGTVTMVFSDIVESTALTHRLGDARWVEILGVHDRIVREQLARYDGREVKSIGDGFLLTFPSARHGLLFGISVQRVLAVERSDAFPVQVRIGVHTGEAVRAGGDLLGGHVNYAARVSAQAGPGEIVASELTRQLAASMGDVVFEDPRTVVLKGFPGEHPVHPVRWWS